jgi:hypothetical protein
MSESEQVEPSQNQESKLGQGLETNKPGPKKRNKPGPKKRSTAGMNPNEQAQTVAHTGTIDDKFNKMVPRRDGDRIGIGSQKRLGGVEKYISPGFKGYMFKTERVEAAFGGGYGLVKDEDGVNITRVSGDDKLYLMQIPIEMWEKDQKAKHQKAVDAMAEAATIDPYKGERSHTDSPQNRAIEVTGTGTDPLFG